MLWFRKFNMSQCLSRQEVDEANKNKNIPKRIQYINEYWITSIVMFSGLILMIMSMLSFFY